MAVYRAAGERAGSHHGHGHARRGSVYRRAAGEVDMQVVILGVVAHAAEQGHHVFQRAARGGFALDAASLRTQLFFLHDTGDGQPPAAGLGHGLDLHGRALMSCPPRPAHAPHRRGCACPPAGRAGRHSGRSRPPTPRPPSRMSVRSSICARPAHICTILTASRPQEAKRPTMRRVLPRHGEARALGGMERDIRDLLRLQRPEENLHAAAAKRGGDILTGCAWSRPPVGNPPGDRF